VRAPLRLPRASAFWLGMTAGWAAYGLILAREQYAYDHLAGRSVSPFLAYLGRAGLDVGMWLWATPLAVALARRFRIARARWIGPVALHLVFGVAIALATAAATYALLWLLAPPGPHLLATYLLFQLDPGVIVYAAIVALTHAVDFYRWYSDQQVAAATLQADLSEARLRILAAQLQPHFLFNTLNVIAELIHEDPERADGMIVRLGDLLRESMSGVEERGVTLEREVATLRAYVDIQQLRFRDRLHVSFDVAPEVREALVPHFLLQPLVENAIRHGGAGSAQPLHVAVVATAAEAAGRPRVHLQVADDGAGSGEWRESGGLGLRNVRARLAHLFDGDCAFALASRVPHGTVCDLWIPHVPVEPARGAPTGGGSAEREERAGRPS